MPKLSPELSAALGTNSSRALSFDGRILLWDSSAPTSDLIGQQILGSKIRWLTSAKLIFESCQSGTCRLYTFDTTTGATAQVSASGADVLYAGGDVWAKWTTGSGYTDSKGRTNATYGVADVDDNGTVLIILNATTNIGLGYLTASASSASNTIPICYDVLDRTPAATIRNKKVIFHSGGVLRQYDTDNEIFTHSNVPVWLSHNDGDWVVGQHLLGLGQVVFNFQDSTGWKLGPVSENYAPDIRISSNQEILTIVTSAYEDEGPNDIIRYQLPITVSGARRRLYELHTTTLGPSPRTSITSTSIDTGPSVVASDVITIREYTANNGGRGYAQVISSANWFGATGGKDIRGAWQYGITAVVAATNATNEFNVTAKDSNNNTYQSGRTSYGNSSVFIRPAPTSTSAAPLWEITWAANSTVYSRVTVNATMGNTTAITNTALTLGTLGILDVASNNTPIAAVDNQSVWYGYVKLQYPLTRGIWTIGKDVSPTCPEGIERLVAWNSNTSSAYVVWHANTEYATITTPAHIALELNSLEQTSAAVVAGQHTVIIRNSQWQLLTQKDLQMGKTPGLFKG